MIPYFKPEMYPTCDYMFWLDSPSNTYKRVVKYAQSYDIALSQYIRDLPYGIDVTGINSRKLESNEEVMS